MTLTSACTPRVVITGNSTRGPYSLVDASSVAIRLVSTGHLKLTRYSASTDDNNDGTVLSLTTDYTVGGTQDARTFTLTSAQEVLTSSQRIVAERVQAYTQDLDLTTGGAFNASSIESRFDKVAEFQQELKARLDRTVPLQFLDATVSAAFPSPPTSATKLLARTTSGEFTHVDPTTITNTDLVLGSGWSAPLAASLGSSWATAFGVALGSGITSFLSATKPTTISGYGITDAYTKTETKALSPGANLFPNSAWDYWPEVADIQAYDANFSSVIATTSVSANTLANPSVFTIADTSLLVDGWIYDASAAATANLKLGSMRATSIVANTSATFYPPIGAVPAGTSAFTLTPRTPGDLGSSGYGPAGWSKTPGLYMICDRNSANQLRNSWAVVALKRNGVGTQYFYWTVPAARYADFAGRDIVQTWAVWHKTKTGSGTPKTFMIINGGATVYGDACSGSSAYESLQQTATLPSTLTGLVIGIELPSTMPAGDVALLSHPMLAYGTALPSFAYSRGKDEEIRGDGHALPDAWNGASITFPAAADAAGTYSFRFDPHAETTGRISPNVRIVLAVLEGKKATPNIPVAVKSDISSPTLYGPRFFSVQDAASGAVMQGSYGQIFLNSSGYAQIYTTTSAAAFLSVSIDITAVIAS